ncbi:MAG TPA: diguanylate cyclase, partial [Dehalococcoidia bacterium]|nr:diguanylate cyclase [Dehalococcoidia bacterium]
EGATSWERFLWVANLLLGQAQRGQRPLAVLIIALDGYPIVESGAQRQVRGQVNRDDGAKAGEALAGILGRLVRTTDVLGRHGATSFAVVVSDTPWVGATRLAERIHAVVRSVKVPVANGQGTVSVGIATRPELAINAQDLVRNAETAVTEAMASGGDQARLYGWDGPDGYLRRQSEQDRLPARREAALSYLTAAAEAGIIASLGLRTQPGACSACRAAAHEVYPARSVPGLPLAGCTSDHGCQCSYTLPALEGYSPLPSVPVEDYDSLGLPDGLRNAALVGSDARRRSSAAELAEYLESYPKLSFGELQNGESEPVLLRRPGHQGWERPSARGRAAQGLRVPLEMPLTSWVADVPVPPSLPEKAVYGSRRGRLQLTEQQLVFSGESFQEAIPLLWVTGVYYLQGAVACALARRDRRLVVRVRDPLPVSLFLAHAVRSALL